jgi:hypothetical protein
MGDIITWPDDSTVAQHMWVDVAGQDRAESPGTDGASPYRGLALILNPGSWLLNSVSCSIIPLPF